MGYGKNRPIDCSVITTIAAGEGIVGVALLIAGIVCLLFSVYAYIHSIAF